MHEVYSVDNIRQLSVKQLKPLFDKVMRGEKIKISTADDVVTVRLVENGFETNFLAGTYEGERYEFDSGKQAFPMFKITMRDVIYSA
jgi:hypothetical protein